MGTKPLDSGMLAVHVKDQQIQFAPNGVPSLACHVRPHRLFSYSKTWETDVKIQMPTPTIAAGTCFARGLVSWSVRHGH